MLCCLEKLYTDDAYDKRVAFAVNVNIVMMKWDHQCDWRIGVISHIVIFG